MISEKNPAIEKAYVELKKLSIVSCDKKTDLHSFALNEPSSNRTLRHDFICTMALPFPMLYKIQL